MQAYKHIFIKWKKIVKLGLSTQSQKKKKTAETCFYSSQDFASQHATFLVFSFRAISEIVGMIGCNKSQRREDKRLFLWVTHLI